MTIRWITPLLGTAPASALHDRGDEFHVVDVRDLVDKPGNNTQAVADKLDIGRALLAQGQQTVVCCDYGMSRSNAVAAGILALAESMSLDAAIRRVQEATGEYEIKLAPLHVVRRALSDHAPSVTRPAGRSVLVTGGSGFLGQPVVANLAADMHVAAPSRQLCDVARGSTQLDVLVGENGADTIVHLANPRVYTSNVAMGATLAMLRNVIDVCVTRDIALVYLSSWEVFSGYRGSLRADESLPALPRGPYAETKWLCEMLIEHARQQLGLRCAVIRSSPVYGPGSDRPKFIFNFLAKAQRGETIVTHQYGNGAPALDLLHVNDLVALVGRVVRMEFSGVVHAGTGQLTATDQIARMLMESMGSTASVDHVAINTDTARIAMDAGLAARLFDWRPEVMLADGLAALIQKSFADRNKQDE